jgi:hypothetical protein
LDSVITAAILALGGSRRPTASQVQGRYSRSFMFPDQLLDEATLGIAQLYWPESWKELVSKRDMRLDSVGWAQTPLDLSRFFTGFTHLWWSTGDDLTG